MGRISEARPALAASGAAFFRSLRITNRVTEPPMSARAAYAL
jgi:hypothetical protein